MVIIYFFDDTQTLLKIENDALSVIQTQELDDTGLLNDSLSVSLPNDESLLNAQYMAVKSHEGNAQSFDMYRIIDSQTSGEVTYFTGIQLAYYELAGYVVEDLRPTARTVSYVAGQLLADTEWRVGYVGNLPNITTNFYYTSVKDAFTQLQSVAGCEVVFKVEISGQGVTDKWVEIYPQLGNKTRKRFTYGDTALDVVREIGQNDVYTALIGRGKGEESGDGFGRKITFEDVAWSIANADPVDKPLGQKHVELPNMTAEYGIPVVGGKRPRIGIVEFDTDDPANLLQLTYQALIETSRPKVLFKASVVNIGDANIGDVVTIHRYDLGIHYETRIRKVERDKLNNNRTRIELGDIVHESSIRKTNSIIRDVSNQIDNIQTTINNVGRTADGKNAITWGNVEPLVMRTGDMWYRDHPVNAGERQMMVYDGNAWVEQEYRADMLTGTFDAQTLNVVNINVDSIVGNTSTFVQSAWNAIGAGVTIDGNGFHSSKTTAGITNEIKLSDGQMVLNSNASGVPTEVLLDGQGLEFTTDLKKARLRFNGTNLVLDNNLGLFGNHINSVNWLRLIGSNDYEMTIHKHPTASGGAIVDSAMVTLGLGVRDSFSSIAQFYGQIDFRRNLHMIGNDIREVNRVALHNSNTHFISHPSTATPGGTIVDSTRFTIGIGSVDTGFNDRITVTNSQIDLRAHTNLQGFRLDNVARIALTETNGWYMHLSSGSALVDTRMVTIATGNLTSVDRVADFYGQIDFHKNLNMNGNVISNQSDGRYKTIKGHVTEDILGMYKTLDFVRFEYTEDNMPRGEHFGLVAQDAGKLGYYDDVSGKWLLNSSDQIMYNSLAVKQLADELDKLKERMGGLQ